MWKIKRSTIVPGSPLPRLFCVALWLLKTCRDLSVNRGGQMKNKKTRRVFLFVLKCLFGLTCQYSVIQMCRMHLAKSNKTTKYKHNTRRWNKTSLQHPEKHRSIWGHIMGWNRNVAFLSTFNIVFCKRSVNVRQGNSVCAHVSLK